jgi:3-methyl-2-oxobutanoate hydroxymethyltransferase
MDDAFQPRFLKKYARLSTSVRDAVAAYADEVRAGTFPGDEHSF